MRNFKFAVLAACLAIMLAGCAVQAGLPDGAGRAPSSAPQSEQGQPFASFVPGATKAWCDSLPYPYCEDPAPGTPTSGGRVPFVFPMVSHPIFGG